MFSIYVAFNRGEKGNIHTAIKIHNSFQTLVWLLTNQENPKVIHIITSYSISLVRV